MREQILEIAEIQMKEGGYDFLNFAIISKQLNTSRANLHYHFKNKETLAVEVTKRFIVDQEADLQKLIAQFHGNFPGLVMAMEDWLWFHRESHGNVSPCVCAQIIRQPEIPEALLNLAKEHFNNFRTMLFSEIQASQENGILRKDVSHLQIGVEVSAIMQGLQQMILIMNDNEIKMLKGTIKNWLKNYTV